MRLTAASIKVSSCVCVRLILYCDKPSITAVLASVSLSCPLIPTSTDICSTASTALRATISAILTAFSPPFLISSFLTSCVKIPAMIPKIGTDAVMICVVN